MNKVEAKSILNAELEKFRAKSYGDLVSLIENPVTFEITTSSGTWYQLEFDATWDDPDKPNDVLRVFGSIDDGGVRAYSPLSNDFLIAPTGEFVGE